MTNGTRGGARPGAGRPKAKTPRRMLSVRINEDTHSRLDQLCSHYGYSKGKVIEKLVRTHKPD